MNLAKTEFERWIIRRENQKTGRQMFWIGLAVALSANVLIGAFSGLWQIIKEYLAAHLSWK